MLGPEVPQGIYQSLLVRTGLAGARVAVAELPRAAGHLFAASGYQECEDQPLLELINSVADSAVPVRPRIRPAHCIVWPTCLQAAARATAAMYFSLAGERLLELHICGQYVLDVARTGPGSMEAAGSRGLPRPALGPGRGPTSPERPG